MAKFNIPSKLKNLSSLLSSRDLGVDLGTCNVLICAENKGLQIREPAVVAMDKNTGKIIQVGTAARNMLGRTPGNVVAMYPLKDGIISDHEMTVKMLQVMFKSATEAPIFALKPRVVISVPSGITEVEERSVINAAIDAGARRVFLIEEPRAAALGAGLDLHGPRGHLVVDLGGGTTDIAILTMNSMAVSSSLKIAGNYLDDQIIRYVRRNRGIVIGQALAESVKIHLGRAYPGTENQMMTLKGRDVNTGTPRTAEITSDEIYELFRRPLHQIADEVLSVLEQASPELVSDIGEEGIIITGGVAQMCGIAEFLTERTGIPCMVADDPATCTARGCGKSLSWIQKMTEGPIKIARSKAMKQ